MTRIITIHFFLGGGGESPQPCSRAVEGLELKRPLENPVKLELFEVDLANFSIKVSQMLKHKYFNSNLRLLL